MNLNKIRNIFIDYFKSKNYILLNHSSLVPFNDESLLFTNSGMVQFKDIFLGLKESKFDKVITVQPVLRISGKHNDLNEIGIKYNHHTFFEMLGNFSFNNSSKKDAIYHNWELLTKYYKIPIKYLFVTVYEKDFETEYIWLNIIKLSSNKLIKIGDINDLYDSDNFWKVGSIGLCGPSTEIFYNQKGNLNFFIKKNKQKFLEICNIVFIKYNKNESGKLINLHKLFIDTGLGLERIASVMQNVNNNYRIDFFKKIILEISREIKIFNINHNFFKIISDHIRTCVFLINDLVLPSNVNRGYILRQILRRAITKGFILGVRGEFFYKLAKHVIIDMSTYYENLKVNKEHIINILNIEEKNFLKLIYDKIFFLKKNLIINTTINSREIYELYNTYGLPLDIIINLFKNLCLKIHKSEFYFFFNFQSSLSKKNSKFRKIFYFNNFFKKKN